ncbi:hypothetical protein TGRUB_258000B, partial [Toxoplasma gondii RUB]
FGFLFFLFLSPPFQLQAVAETASPLSVLLAASALQERKWLLGEGEEAASLNVKKENSKKSCVALQRIQETLLRNAHSFSDAFFVRTLKLLFSPAFALAASERALLVTQLDQRLTSMHASLLPQVASALTQNRASRNAALSASAFSSSSISSSSASSASSTSASSTSASSTSASSPASPSPREDFVRRRLFARLLPLLLSDARDSLFSPLAPASLFSSSSPASHVPCLSGETALGSEASLETFRTSERVTACVASCGRLLPLSVEQRMDLKGLLKALVRDARDRRPAKRNGEDAEQAVASLRSERRRIASETHTSLESSLERKQGACEQRKRESEAPDVEVERGQINAWIHMTELPSKSGPDGKYISSATSSPSSFSSPTSTSSSSAPSTSAGDAAFSAASESFASPLAPPVSPSVPLSSEASEGSSADPEVAQRVREAQLAGELLHLPLAMAALGSADALLFFDCVEGVYKFLPRYSDAQLATFCRRAALVQFEKKDETQPVDGFHLFTLFLLDRMPTMSPPRQEKLAAVLAAFVGNCPPHLAASLSLLASSFLIHMHPNVVRGTGNLWSGVDPLNAPSRRFSLAISNATFATLMSHLSRISSLFLSPAASLSSSSSSSSVETKKLLAALRVYRRSLERASQERSVLASLHACDLINLLEATLRLKHLAIRAPDGKAKPGVDDDAGEASEQMARVFTDLLSALHKKASSLTVGDAEALLGVLNLLGQRSVSPKKSKTVSRPVSVSPATAGLLARLLHIAITRPEKRDRPSSVHVSSGSPVNALVHSDALQGPQIFPELQANVARPQERLWTDTVPTRGQESLLSVRPLSFTQFLSETSRGTSELAGLGEDHIKQLRAALQILLPRPLEVFKSSGLPDDVLALLLFSVEATSWLLSEVGALRTSFSRSAAALSRFASPRLSGVSLDEGEEAEEKEEGESEEANGREAAALMLFGITRQTLAGAFGVCGMMLEEMQAKDRRRTQVVGLTSRLARLLPADIAASTDRRYVTEALLRTLPADVESLRLACVALLGLRAVRRQETLLEKTKRRKEKRRQNALRLEVQRKAEAAEGALDENRHLQES